MTNWVHFLFHRHRSKTLAISSAVMFGFGLAIGIEAAIFYGLLLPMIVGEHEKRRT